VGYKETDGSEVYTDVRKELQHVDSDVRIKEYQIRWLGHLQRHKNFLCPKSKVEINPEKDINLLAPEFYI
jgi:hypothetical protein